MEYRAPIVNACVFCFHPRLSRDYLQAHQADLDNFSRQMRGSKRNSRLARFQKDFFCSSSRSL